MPIVISARRLSLFALGGRILLAAIFLISGVGKILQWSAVTGVIAAHGLPFPGAFLLVATVVELVGGLSILFGVKARWGAALLFAYLIPVTLIMHNFWAFSGLDAQAQMANFLKNLAIMGGFLQVMAFGPGMFSLDESRYHKGHKIMDDRDSSIKLRRVS